MPGSRPPVDILLVEDNHDDADLMVEALDESDLTVRVAVVEDGEEAVRYLRRTGPYAQVGRPDLILLDLHLPRLSGREVLAEIKADPVLRLIPVIVLTSLKSDQVIGDVYDLHANCCVSKPGDLDQFAQTVKRIETFWLHFASRPQGQ